ncbi:hypothetical protein AMJ83_06300 [candidate division WOR_3 bacterium SM23_42]|uniref:PatA-like N-terminal domain-containing protein n=1 Tax=candidate division WOR_3 bacterium SM23_42 TaxID=1703779 RepID=A0A0S8FUS8_UNCW3|nr:MAG: hypothetical protein AMJ83_06300 [candidate division WOR_3 bacterium SM23_42]
MSLAGDLQDFEITDVFQLIQLGQKDGILRLQTADDVGIVYFKNGMVAHAQTNTIQGEPAIDTILGWKKGKFTFNPGEETDQRTVDLPIQQVILEAARRIDELKRIQKLIPSFDVIVEIMEVPQTGVEKIQLNPREWKVLSFVDGTSTIKQIAQKSNIPEFETAKVFYGMISSGLVKVVSRVAEKTEAKKEAPKPDRGVGPKEDGWFSKLFKKP